MIKRSGKKSELARQLVGQFQPGHMGIVVYMRLGLPA